MVTASLQCIIGKASLLISYMMTLSLEKEISAFFLNLEKVSNLYNYPDVLRAAIREQLYLT